MKLQTIERHGHMIKKLRTELGCGATPWQLIRRPKGMKTVHFDRKIRMLRHHEKELKQKLPIYLLQ